VIYVPQHDPDVVYSQPYSQNVGPLLTFGAGFAVGSRLSFATTEAFSQRFGFASLQEWTTASLSANPNTTQILI
jgi:hypothetical protein